MERSIFQFFQKHGFFLIIRLFLRYFFPNFTFFLAYISDLIYTKKRQKLDEFKSYKEKFSNFFYQSKKTLEPVQSGFEHFYQKLPK